jgi:flagellin-specific chaperone FliS
LQKNILLKLAVTNHILVVYKMRKLLKELYDAWIEARQATVKARMVDGHWY